MTRREFMGELERLLGDVPVEEREEALRYYEGYFDDALMERYSEHSEGVDGESHARSEQDVIDELGFPSRIAQKIRNDLREGGRPDYGEYTEQGYRDGKEGGAKNRFELATGRRERQSGGRSSNGNYSSGSHSSNDNVVKVVLVVLAIVFLAPVWGGLFGVLLGVVGTLFGLLVGSAGLSIALVVGGVVAVGVGLFNLFFHFPFGIMVLGIGMVSLGLGIVATFATIGLWGALLKLVRWVVDKVNHAINKNKQGGAQS